MKTATHKLNALNVSRLIMQYSMAFLRYGIFGNSVRIEASTACQLKCPSCVHTTDGCKFLGIGHLKFGNFKKFVDAYPCFRNIELSNYGEMFLNPELEEMIKYAFCKKVNLTAFNGVHLNTAKKGTLESLVRYRFKAIAVSLDGASNAIYKIYRVGGDFDNVIDNVREINHFKKKYNSAFPKLYWQFVIFGHNEHELPEARKMAEELNMEFVPRLNRRLPYSPIKDEEFVRKQVGAASVGEYQQKNRALYLPLCLQFWSCPQINWDGKLLGCCLNRSHDFGNVFEEGLKACVANKKYRYIKRMLFNKRMEAGNDIPCFSCGEYKKIQSVSNPFVMLQSVIPFVTKRIF